MSHARTYRPLVTTSEAVHRRVADTKDRVSATAARMFSETSFEGISVETIVSEAGVARSTFYRFYQDKEDLFRQIINPVFDGARIRLEQLDIDVPESIVDGIAESYLDTWEEHRDALILAQNVSGAVFPLVEESHNAFAAVLGSLMIRLNDARMLRHDDPHLATVMLAQTAVRILQVCERHPQFRNVYRSTLRGLLLKW